MRRLRAASLALVLVSVCAPAAHAQAQQDAVAQVRFNKGRELFIAGKFAEAVVEFRAATQLFESPNTRLYLGRCERELGHLANAYFEFSRAASEAADRAHSDPRYTSTRDAAKQEASALENKIAHVTIVSPAGLPDGTTITVNGNALGTAGVGVAAPIDPGPVEVVAKAPGYIATKKTANASAGESIEVKIQLEKEPAAATTTTNANTTTNTTTTAEDPNAHPETVRQDGPRSGRGLRNAGFVVGAFGIVGMGVFATFSALAQTRFDQLKGQCNGPCDASLNPKIDEGQTYQNVANIALAVGATALITGAIMIVAGVSTNGPSTTALRPHVVPIFSSAQVPSGIVFGVGRAF